MVSVSIGNKQVRRKHFADLAIQGTNNSSIASKRSVEVVYYPKLRTNKSIDGQETLEYFKYFVPKPLKRSPCINRGYWLRLHAIRSRLDEISAKTKGPVMVINLGCGFDPLPFQLLDRRNSDSKNYWDRFTFLDVDYPGLIDEKLSIIALNDELKNVVGEELSYGKYANYSLVACNLNYPDSFAQVVESLDGEFTKVFIAEVSLAYMNPDQADQIIELCSTLKHSHFLMLEQLTPASNADPFAHQMLRHFDKNRSPLLSVLRYQSVESQKQRFDRLRLPHINAGDMFQLWCSLGESIKSALEQVEPFDELEEFHLFAHHYIILHATNDSFEFDRLPPVELPYHENIDTISVPMEYFEVKKVRKFGASILDPNMDKMLYFGGLCPQRTNELISMDFQGNCENILHGSTAVPSARACHTFTLVNNDMAIAIAGRKNPWQSLSDTWKFNLHSHEWTEGPNLPDARYRHATCLLQENKLLILGGKTESSHGALLLDVEHDRIEGVESRMPALISPAVDYNVSARRGVLIGGGCCNETSISDHVYVFTYDENNTLQILDTLRDPLFCRYGAQAKFITDHEIVLAGGTGPFLFDSRSMVILLDINSHSIKSISLPNQLPLMVGATLQFNPVSRELVLAAGGATCYGFGSVWNHGTRIKLMEGKYKH